MGVEILRGGQKYSFSNFFFYLTNYCKYFVNLFINKIYTMYF